MGPFSYFFLPTSSSPFLFLFLPPLSLLLSPIPPPANVLLSHTVGQALGQDLDNSSGLVYNLS